MRVTLKQDSCTWGMRASAAALLLAILNGCSEIGEQLSDIMFVPHHRSAEVQGEQTKLTLLVSDIPTPRGAAAIAPLIVGAALDQVGKAIDAESQRYIATYSAGKSANVFNNGGKKLVGIGFERRVHTAPDKNDLGVVAMRFCALIVKGDDQGKFFSLVPYAIDFHFSKAKVVAFDGLSPFGFDLLNPWEFVTDWFSEGPKLFNDENVDMTIEISISNLIYDEKTKKPKTIDLGKRELNFKKLKMQSPDEEKQNSNPIIKATCGKFMNDKDEQNVTDINKQVNEKESSIQQGKNLDFRTFFATPAPSSKNSNMTFYTVNVKVTEVDDFGARVKELGKTFSSEKQGIQDKFTNMFTGGP